MLHRKRVRGDDVRHRQLENAARDPTTQVDVDEVPAILPLVLRTGVRMSYASGRYACGASEFSTGPVSQPRIAFGQHGILRSNKQSGSRARRSSGSPGTPFSKTLAVLGRTRNDGSGSGSGRITGYFESGFIFLHRSGSPGDGQRRGGCNIAGPARERPPFGARYSPDVPVVGSRISRHQGAPNGGRSVVGDR